MLAREGQAEARRVAAYSCAMRYLLARPRLEEILMHDVHCGPVWTQQRTERTGTRAHDYRFAPSAAFYRLFLGRQKGSERASVVRKNVIICDTLCTVAHSTRESC